MTYEFTPNTVARPPVDPQSGNGVRPFLFRAPEPDNREVIEEESAQSTILPLAPPPDPSPPPPMIPEPVAPVTAKVDDLMEDDDEEEDPFAPPPSISARAGRAVGTVARFTGGAMAGVGRAVTAPAPIYPSATAENRNNDDLDELFEVPQATDNDMMTDHLLGVGEADDLDDLVTAGEMEPLDDLFDIGSDDDFNDLLAVEEVLGVDDDEDLSDILEVKDADIMGTPLPPRRVAPRRTPLRRYNPPAGIGGVKEY